MEHQPEVVLASPLPQATMSARILAEILGAPIAPPDPLYAEWLAPDCVLGVGPDDYPSEHQAWRSERLRRPESALPRGESLTELRRGAMKAASRGRDEAARDGMTLIGLHCRRGRMPTRRSQPSRNIPGNPRLHTRPAMIWPACPTPKAAPPRWR
ncbi:histidine phosphatase family protein [Plantactinospora mayteni]|uniref:histidine phosphatase family protein n=1 Tax=Plantactinospora mayteni TaxID=566021 RepID=UPI003557D234